MSGAQRHSATARGASRMSGVWVRGESKTLFRIDIGGPPVWPSGSQWGMSTGKAMVSVSAVPWARSALRGLAARKGAIP